MKKQIFVSGRTELAGNHTDHQKGRMLASAVHFGHYAQCEANGTNIVRVQSEGFKPFEVNLTHLTLRTGEFGTPKSLIRGVVVAFKELGLDEVPATMEEFIEAAKTRGTYSLNVSGVGDWDMYPYFWLFGGVLTDDGFTKASGYLDSDASIAAMQKIVELHDEKVFTIRDVDGSVDAWDGINSEYAMFFEGPWYFGSYEDSLSKGITAATIPTYEGRSASVVGGEDIAVFATSAHPEAAYEFAKFMTSEDVQLAMLEAGQLPILKSLVSSEAVQSNPVWSVYMQQMESAKARIPSPNNSAIQEIWSETVTSIFVDGADVAQALHDAAARIDEQLS